MNGAGRIIVIAAFFLCGGSVCSGRSDSTVIAIRHDVEFFADSVCAGRATGTPGASEATWHILRRLRSSGLEPQMQSFDCGGSVGRNVIAEIYKSASRQWIVIMAYYDGLGVRAGSLYPCADSNASGTAVLLSLADSLAELPLRYNVLIAALDGHNKDFAGAAELMNRTLKNRNIRMVVDLDILGSALAPYKPYQKNYLIALGGRPYKRTFDALGIKYGLAIYFDYYGSNDFTDLFYNRMGDRSLFIRQGLPVTMFTSGITMNTNKVCDIAQTLDFEQTCRRLSVILDWLKTL